MRINEIMKEECTNFDVELSTKEEVFSFLSEQLYECGVIESKTDFMESLWYRESIGETGLEGGIAMPHGKSKTVHFPCVAYVQLKTPIYWESMDENNQQAKHVFMLAVPDTKDNSDHLKMLSFLATSIVKKESIEKISLAKTSKELFEVFETVF